MLLLHEYVGDGVFVLFGLVVFKLFVIGWCLVCGYCGGLVFLLIYVGVVFSLVFGGWGELGMMIGVVVGIFIVLSNLFFGVVIVLVLLLVKLYLVGFVGVVGVVLVKRVGSFGLDDVALFIGWGL